ncbi:MAG: lipid II:glycine glycyltransferase FemX [Thermoflexales bacterium]
MRSLLQHSSWQEVCDPTTWDRALASLPNPHILQSWAWGEFKSRWGWRAERWLLRATDGTPRAAVQVLWQHPPRLPLCVLYAPKGPLCADTDAYQAALRWVMARARARRAIWAKVDGEPPLPLPHARQLLAVEGWRYSPQQIQFRNTAITDLRQSDAELLAAMKPKWRYNLRLAERRGVRVRLATTLSDADAHLLYALYAETARRDRFAIRTASYYYDAWRAMRGVALFAEREGETLAAGVLFCFGGKAWFFYGMSRSEGREHMPNHLLQWHAMRWARDHGCHTYDWWGAPEDPHNPHDRLAGVWRFKEGAGARFVEGIGAWDYAPFPPAYRAYLRFSKLLHSLRSHRSSELCANRSS